MGWAQEEFGASGNPWLLSVLDMSALMSGLFLEHSSHLRDHSYKSRITKPKYLQSCTEHPSQAVYGFSHKYVENLLKSPWPVSSFIFFFSLYSPGILLTPSHGTQLPSTIPAQSLPSLCARTSRIPGGCSGMRCPLPSQPRHTARV